MPWDAVVELSSLLERFRRPSVAQNCNGLNAEWTTFRRARFKEGGLWLPSHHSPLGPHGIQAASEGALWLPSSESGALIWGFVYLADGREGTPAFVESGGKKKQACYSTITKAAAAEFRRLAKRGGDIITRIPQLEAELRPFVDGNGVGPEPDDERWWLAWMFRVANPTIAESDNGIAEGLTYETEVKRVYRASEVACEKLMMLLENDGRASFASAETPGGGNDVRTARTRKDWLKCGPPPADWHQTPLVGQMKQIADWLGATPKPLRANNGKTHWIIGNIGCDPETKWPAPFAIYFQSREKFVTVNAKRRVEADKFVAAAKRTLEHGDHPPELFVKQPRASKTKRPTKGAKGNEGERKGAVPQHHRGK